MELYWEHKCMNHLLIHLLLTPHQEQQLVTCCKIVVIYWVPFFLRKFEALVIAFAYLPLPICSFSLNMLLGYLVPLSRHALQPRYVFSPVPSISVLHLSGRAT